MIEKKLYTHGDNICHFRAKKKNTKRKKFAYNFIMLIKLVNNIWEFKATVM